MQLRFRATAPLWTKEMATPQTVTHAHEQTRRDKQARKNDDAARARVEMLADFRQRATGPQHNHGARDREGQSKDDARTPAPTQEVRETQAKERDKGDLPERTRHGDSADC